MCHLPSPSPFNLSSQQLLTHIEKVITGNLSEKHGPWIVVQLLIQEFQHHYGVNLETLVQQQGYSDSLRNFLVRSGQFSIYGTATPETFYIKPLQTISSPKSTALGAKNQPACYTIKRSWKVDGRLVKMLREEGAVEIKPPLTEFSD